MIKIVAAEDDNFLANFYLLKFEKAGIDCTLLKDGLNVVETVKKVSPDMVLLDILMPNKNGFEVLKELKDEPKTKNVPVIMLTALSSSEDKDKANKLGAYDYIVKTDFSFEDIISEIQKIAKNNN